MPKEITHWTIAEKIYLFMDDDSFLKTVIRRHKNLYLVGAVIFDTPFYLFFGKMAPVLNQLAGSIHDTAGNSYRPLINAFAFHGKNLPGPVLALNLGILTHIHCDSIFHPLVYYFSGTDKENSTTGKAARIRHHTLETYLDLYYRARFQLKNKGLMKNLIRHLEIDISQLVTILSVMFPQASAETWTAMHEAIQRHIRVQQLFDNNPVKIVLNLLNRLPGIDVQEYLSNFYPMHHPRGDLLFNRPVAYRHPVTGVYFQHTIKDLETRCINETAKRFEKIKDFDPPYLSQYFQRICRGPNLNTGMIGVNKSDMKYFNTKKNLTELIFSK